MKKIILGIACGFLFTMSACVKQPSYPPYPILTDISVSKTAINLYPSTGGASLDSVLVTVNFTDGEGGIGPETGTTDTATSVVPCTVHSYDVNVINNPAYNVFWYEYQQGPDSCIDRLATAYVPNNPKYSGLSGTIQFYPTIECPPTGNVDTVYFSVFIKDRAGKLSNRLRTPGIIVTCH